LRRIVRSAENRGVKDFKEFLLRGNLVELAVAVVIGVAFAALVNSFVENLVTPLIAALGGEQDFSALTFTINDSVFRYGAFVNALLSFLIIAAVIYFFVVKPVNALMARRKSEGPLDEATRECPECLSSIPAAARRCAFCTAQLSPHPPGG
jgi:large conductance mechanosensitive channel